MAFAVWQKHRLRDYSVGRLDPIDAPTTMINS